MNYVVNDIEDFNAYCKLSVIDILFGVQKNFSITMTRLNQYSLLKQKEYEKMISCSKVIDAGLDLYMFKRRYKSEFIALSDGDISSIYLAFKNNEILITSNQTIIKICNKLEIETITFESLIRMKNKGEIDVDRINNLKVIYRKVENKAI